MLAKERIVGFIGAGNMAYGLIKGMRDSESNIKILFYDPDDERTEFVKNNLRVNALSSIGEIVENCDTVFIAVKPYSVESVLEVSAQTLNNFIKGKKPPVFVSIAGGIKIDFIERIFDKMLKDPKQRPPLKIFRVMPNINSLVGKGMSVICHNVSASEEDACLIVKLIETSSKVVMADEKYFDAVTALSGSGPAYIFLIAEGLIEAGVKLGLPKEIAKTLSVQTILGSAEILNSSEFSKTSTKELKDMVTSSGGTTAYGLAKLEEGRIKYVIDSAVDAAYLRAKGLI
ncbi:pyrroline-5-carboxylate reductase [Candidatus Acidulodesulfobacterium sp. H_13]|uniref:pyrroline-5-carboxylate reductase n=1 Tax=Candidatus Acidulodesulfobacterium sp. H_13 TaxID=3395470 RepID=UPI003AF82FA7